MLRVNERILCFHGPLLYEAKVLKAADWAEGQEIESDQPKGAVGCHYFVHYKGWKNTWDEWVPEDRALEWTEENIKTQKELKAAATAAIAPKNKPSDKKRDSIVSKADSDVGSKASPAPRGQKRGREGELDKEETFVKRSEIKITVPDTLKEQLVDDWENITKNHQLVPLPRTPNVVTIVEDFKKSVAKRRSGSADAEIFDEIMAGIKVYFDRSLGTVLLYRFERQQYLDLRREQDNPPASEVYGVEHLLRLFVTLPELIAHTNMDQPSISVLKEHVEDFLQYLSKRRTSLFLSDYINASPNYEGLARGA